jgi:hypothetical protein
MMKKIFILGLILCSFLVVSISPVIAAGETHTITDDTDDVIDYLGEFVIGRKNVDINEVTCTKDGKQVTLSIKLVEGGIIQNSDSVIYMISLVTSDNRYDLAYNNDSCVLIDLDYNEIDCSYSGAGTNTLAVSFDLNNSNEEYIFVYAATDEITDDGEEYIDYAPVSYEDLPLIYPSDDFPTEGTENLFVGESIDFSASVEGGTSPYTWKWNFGDGKTSEDEESTTHVYDEAGTYKVIVLVTDDNGYSDIFYSTLDITASDGGNNNGGNNNGGDSNGEDGKPSSNSGLILFAVIIIAIVVVGIAIIVYVIRR